MHTQLMRRHHSYELIFMQSWEVYAILWRLPSCVIDNIRLWRLWSMGTVHKSEAPLGGRLPLCVLRKLNVCSFLRWLPLLGRFTPNCGVLLEGLPYGSLRITIAMIMLSHSIFILLSLLKLINAWEFHATYGWPFCKGNAMRWHLVALTIKHGSWTLKILSTWSLVATETPLA